METLQHIDILGRRLRYAPPQPRPTDRAIKLTERDFAMFELIKRHHGMLPGNYLFEFTKRLNPNRIRFQHRLTKLYNGTVGGTRYLAEPPQQRVSEYSGEQPIIYELHPKAEEVLQEHGRGPRFTHKRANHFVHRFMSACRSASLEFAVMQAGHTFLTLDNIFLHRKCPESTRSLPNPLSLPLGGFDQKLLFPDDLFGIQYAGEKPTYRFFAVEDDRKTESIDSKRYAEDAFATKAKSYVEVMRNDIYKEHWGIPNLRVLTLTTNLTHLHNLRKSVLKIAGPEYAKRFLFKCRTEFGTSWRVPPVMRDLYDQPWLGADGSFFSLAEV